MSEENKSRTTFVQIIAAVIGGVFLILSIFVKGCLFDNTPVEEIIVSGNVSQNKVFKNEEFTLNWQIYHADECVISYDNKSIPKSLGGSMLISTNKDITITITGKKGALEKSHEIDVKVDGNSISNQNDTILEKIIKKVDFEEIIIEN